VAAHGPARAVDAAELLELLNFLSDWLDGREVQAR
jgi:hypothetical protein